MPIDRAFEPRLKAYAIPVVPADERLLDQAYFTAARTRELDVLKQPERQKVLRHLLDHHVVRDNARLRLLSNPGLHWHFERMVEQELGEHKAFFVGIERAWPVIEFGLQFMPGKNKSEVEWGERRRGKDLLNGYITNKAAMFYASIEDWPRLSRQLPHESAGKIRIENWRELTRWTAFWIDIWQPCLRVEFARLLRDLLKLAAPCAVQAPYAITCQYGRDPLAGRAGGSVESRAEGIAKELSRDGWQARTTDCWYYFGLNQTRMMTVCGVLESESHKLAATPKFNDQTRRSLGALAGQMSAEHSDLAAEARFEVLSSTERSVRDGMGLGLSHSLQRTRVD